MTPATYALSTEETAFKEETAFNEKLAFNEELGPSRGGWTGPFRAWFHARRRKKARKRIVRDLLSYDERYLEDLGLSRWELVREFGQDPYRIPELYRWRARGLPHF